MCWYVLVIRLSKVQTSFSRSNCLLVHYLFHIFLTENKVQSAVSVINLTAYCVVVVSVGYMRSTWFYRVCLRLLDQCLFLVWFYFHGGLCQSAIFLLICLIAYYFVMLRQREMWLSTFCSGRHYRLKQCLCSDFLNKPQGQSAVVSNTFDC